MGFAMRSRRDPSAPRASVGIDLGTHSSRVATWQDGDVIVIPNERGRLSTPAVVAFTETGVLVGEAAEEQADTNLANTIFAPTRLIGSKFENPWVQWHSSIWPSSIVRGEGDRPLLRVQDRGKEQFVRPEEVVTLLLEHLRRNAERYLGARVSEAVITMPAQFGPQQCAALAEACSAARMRVLDLVKAPTAAGIAFSQMNPSESRRMLLVCDIGGSYFDFSLLNIEEADLSERAVGTDYVDLDSTLVRFAVRDLRERFNVELEGKQVSLYRLRVSCEAARRKLVQFHQAWIEVKEVTPEVDYSAGISRSHFEDCCQPDLEHVLDPIDWCLEDCGLSRGEVEVVLVGGNARVPQVRRLVRAFFYGRAPHEVLRPDHAAVLGAAVYGALLSPETGGSNALASSTTTFRDEQGNERPPATPKPLRVRQVAPGRTEDASVGEPARDDSLPARSSDDLEPAPCNEATGWHMPLAGRASRPASALRLPVPPKRCSMARPLPPQKVSPKALLNCDMDPRTWEAGI